MCGGSDELPLRAEDLDSRNLSSTGSGKGASCLATTVAAQWLTSLDLNAMGTTRTVPTRWLPKSCRRTVGTEDATVIPAPLVRRSVCGDGVDMCQVLEVAGFSTRSASTMWRRRAIHGHNRSVFTATEPNLDECARRLFGGVVVLACVYASTSLT